MIVKAISHIRRIRNESETTKLEYTEVYGAFHIYDESETYDETKTKRKRTPNQILISRRILNESSTNCSYFCKDV